MKDNPLMKYSEQLAVDIEKMCKSLDNKKDNANTILQIRKSSSSVFANISEAQYPQSLPDMLSKFKIARKECVETESWLKLLFSSGSIDEETFKNYRNLCGRIQRMLTSSCITIEKKICNKKQTAIPLISRSCGFIFYRLSRVYNQLLFYDILQEKSKPQAALFVLRFHNRHRFFVVNLLLCPSLFVSNLHLLANLVFSEIAYNHHLNYMQEQTVVCVKMM